MSERIAGSASPAEVARATAHGTDAPGDAADQAERLTMIMEAEATHNALNGGGGEGSLDDLPIPSRTSRTSSRWRMRRTPATTPCTPAA